MGYLICLTLVSVFGEEILLEVCVQALEWWDKEWSLLTVPTGGYVRLPNRVSQQLFSSLFFIIIIIIDICLKFIITWNKPLIHRILTPCTMRWGGNFSGYGGVFS